MNKLYLLSEFVYCFLVLSWKPIMLLLHSRELLFEEKQLAA